MFPTGLAVYPAGDLFVVDTTVRRAQLGSHCCVRGQCQRNQAP